MTSDPTNDAAEAPIGGARRARRQAEAAALAAEQDIETLRPGLSADAVDNAGEGPPRRRRVRKPFGNMDQKMAYPDRPGYHRHWFNDVPGRLMRAEDAGYDLVMDPNGKPVSLVVGIGRGGTPLTAYLHEIPQEDYDEDMAAQESVVRERLGQIERGAYEKPSGRDGQLQYAGSAKGEISIRSGLRR